MLSFKANEVSVDLQNFSGLQSMLLAYLVLNIIPYWGCLFPKD